MQRKVPQQVKSSGRSRGRCDGKIMAPSGAGEATTQGEPSVAGPGLLEASRPLQPPPCFSRCPYQPQEVRALSQKCRGCKEFPQGRKPLPVTHRPVCPTRILLYAGASRSSKTAGNAEMEGLGCSVPSLFAGYRDGEGMGTAYGRARSAKCDLGVVLVCVPSTQTPGDLCARGLLGWALGNDPRGEGVQNGRAIVLWTQQFHGDSGMRRHLRVSRMKVRWGTSSSPPCPAAGCRMPLGKECDLSLGPLP